MDYTDNQYALMEKLDKHIFWYNLSEDERDMLSYLEKERIARPRVDIADGLWTLSQDGERVLGAHRQKIRASEIQSQKELEALQAKELIRQEAIKKEEAEKQEKLEQIIADKRERKAERKAEHAFQYKLSFISALYGALFGALISNLDRIIRWMMSLF